MCLHQRGIGKRKLEILSKIGMNKPVFIAGPCVIESMELLDEVATELVRLNKKYDIDIIFKASFDKANRTSLQSHKDLQ